MQFHALPRIATHCHALPRIAMYCHALPRIAMYCNALQVLGLCIANCQGRARCRAAAMLATWLLAGGSDIRWGPSRLTLPPEALFPPLVRERLAARAGAGSSLDPLAKPSQWFHKFGVHDCGKILGAAVWRMEFSDHLSSILSEECNVVRDMFLTTKYSESPLAFMKRVDSFCLESPRQGLFGNRQPKAKSMFKPILQDDIAHMTGQMCQHSGAPAAVKDVLELWAQGFGKKVVDSECLFSIAITVPVSFCKLLACGDLGMWAVPLVSKKLWGHVGLQHAECLVGKAGVGEKILCKRPGRNDLEMDLGSQSMIEFFDELGNIIRGLADVATENPDLDTVQRQLVWLQNRRDYMRLERMWLTRKVHKFTHIVSAVVGSGLLKQAGDLISMLTFASKLISDDPAMQNWILDQVKSKNILSRASIYRYRMGIHLAWCRTRSDETEMKMLRSTEGFMVWRTVDSSPQHGYDWLLNGVRIMSIADVPRAYMCSQTLLSPDSSEEDKEEGPGTRKVMRVLGLEWVV